MRTRADVHPHLDPWEQLFCDFEAADRLRHQRTTMAEQELHEFETRCARAELEVMNALASTLMLRAAQFEARGAGQIAVTHPSHPPLRVDGANLSMRFLAIQTGLSAVDLYAHHVRGSTPWVHFCHRWTNDMRPRLVSLVGARVAPRAEGFELLNPPIAGRPAERCSVDALAFRVVQCLLTAERGRLARGRRPSVTSMPIALRKREKERARTRSTTHRQ